MSTRNGWLVVLATLLAASPGTAAVRGFSVRPPAPWVLEGEVPAAAAPGHESTGTHYLLFDRQIRAGGAEQEEYVRTVWKVETTAGLQDASEVEITFTPSFQRLLIHHAKVLRNGRVAWSFSPAEVRVTDAEQDLDARLYNDRQTATVLLKGLRVGDTVDYAFTLAGRNPVLGGRFEAVLGLSYSERVERVHRRVLWQGESALRMNARGAAPKPTVSKTASGTDYEWVVSPAQPVRAEDRTPSWYTSSSRVELTDFSDWAAVVRRERELFAEVDAEAPSVDALVRSFKLSSAPEEARVERAVRFVQDEVRYLGLEMGPHSHQPHSPAQTLERRFGDCKDKAALLVAILRRLGVPAWPALVSTGLRQALDDRLPGMFAFDHVIVGLRAGGAVQFVDATASEQGGHVLGRRPPPYARALLIDEATRGLTTMPYPAPEAPTVDVVETFALPAWNAPARLEVVTTYRDEEADEMRHAQARETRAELGRRYRNFYAEELGSTVRELEPPRVEDDRGRNVVVVREAYEVPESWSGGAREFHAWLIDSKLTRPRSLDRSSPLALSHPDHVRQTMTIRLPAPPAVAALRETVDGGAFALDASWSVRGNEAQLQYTYRSLRGSLPPEKVREFAARVGRATDLLVCRVAAAQAAAVSSRPAARAVTRTVSPAAVAYGRPAARQAAPSWLGPLVAVGCVLGLAAWTARVGVTRWRADVRRTAFRQRRTVAVGEQPETAFTVERLDELATEGFGAGCGCAAAWREVERTRIAYDGRPMTVVTRRCAACGDERAVYFVVAAP